MRPSDQKPVHSPYVVVLGGNSPRRKSTPPPDASEYQVPHESREVQAHEVIKEVKTMARDLESSKSRDHEIPKEKKRWWSFKRTKNPKDGEMRTPAPVTATVAAPERTIHQQEVTAHPARQVIDVPSESERVQKSPYRSRFMRGIAKKGYLTSKLSIELPFHAKAGIGIALLVLVVGVPVLSRFMAKPAPVTAGTVVALGTEALVAQVGKSIELPVGESPLVVIATADDIRRLNVPDSKPGDKVLIYQKTGKIVVYDAEKDKVLGVVNRSQP